MRVSWCGLLEISLKSDRPMLDKASNKICLVELEDAVLSVRPVRKIRKGKKMAMGKWFLRIVLLMLLFNQQVQAAEPDISIGLLAGQFSFELTASDDFSVSGSDGQSASLKKGKYFLNAADGSLHLAGQNFREKVVFSPVNRNKFLAVNKQNYRGQIQVLINGNKKLTVNNLVPLESYVAAVLAPKSSPIWPDEAIKAQAVAVRSLAWYFRQNSGESYALKANDPDMFYGGVRNENTLTSSLAAKTYGQVLYYEGAPAMTYTTESSGGLTASAAEVLGTPVDYLVSVKDYDDDSPSYHWTKIYSSVDVSRILAQNGYTVGKLRSYRLSPLKTPYAEDRTATGRVRQVYFKGNQGDAQVDGAQMASMFGLNSTLFELVATRVLPDKLEVPIENPYGMEIGSKEIPIEVKEDDNSRWKQVLPGYVLLSGNTEEKLVFKGRGYGSGLGLSKWGARGMADSASDCSSDYYKTILGHYYPGTYVVQVY